MVLFNSYGPCEAEANLCDFTIAYSVDSEQHHEFSLNCFAEASDCRLLLECKECSIESSFAIDFQLSHMLSYSSGISLRTEADSSIPGAKSELVQSVYPEQEKVFRGYPPSEFYISMVGSVFKDDSHEGVGFHVLKDRSPVAGATTYTSQVPFTSDLLVKASFDLNEHSLLTERKPKESLLLLTLVYIGALAGFLWIVGLFMSLFERLQAAVSSKVQTQKSRRGFEQQRHRLKTYLHMKESNSPRPTEVFSPQVCEYVFQADSSHELGEPINFLK